LTALWVKEFRTAAFDCSRSESARTRFVDAFLTEPDIGDGLLSVVLRIAGTLPYAAVKTIPPC
jgi:hypothetical protein